jgi:hypothetical protein
MHTDNNTLRTFPFRVKDKKSGNRLTAAAHAVNLVWNHCNGAQFHALTHNNKWPGKAELERPTIKSDTFAQVARGRWYCNLVCACAIKPHGRSSAVGIGLAARNILCLGCQALSTEAPS